MQHLWLQHTIKCTFYTCFGTFLQFYSHDCSKIACCVKFTFPYPYSHNFIYIQISYKCLQNFKLALKILNFGIKMALKSLKFQLQRHVETVRLAIHIEVVPQMLMLLEVRHCCSQQQARAVTVSA